MTYYGAHILYDNDTPSAVDFGVSASETTAARKALEQSNLQRCNMCVVEWKKGVGSIVERIRYNPDVGEAYRPEPKVDAPSRYLTTWITTDAARDFITEHAIAGRVVTITPTRGHDDKQPGYVNIVASM